MLARNSVAAAILVSVAAIACSAAASAEDLTFRARSSHPDIVDLEFRSQSRNVAWPGDSTYYKLEDDDYHTIKIRCEYGEQVCYGAWVVNRDDIHWGRARDGRHGCSACCYTCNGTSHTINLTE